MNHNYDSGFERSSREGKLDYTLIPRDLLDALATHYQKGAEKHGRDNWRKAGSVDEMNDAQASLMRHTLDFIMGKTDEDHGMACVFNIQLIRHIRNKLSE